MRSIPTVLDVESIQQVVPNPPTVEAVVQLHKPSGLAVPGVDVSAWLGETFLARGTTDLYGRCTLRFVVPPGRMDITFKFDGAESPIQTIPMAIAVVNGVNPLTGEMVYAPEGFRDWIEMMVKPMIAEVWRSYTNGLSEIDLSYPVVEFAWAGRPDYCATHDPLFLKELERRFPCGRFRNYTVISYNQPGGETCTVHGGEYPVRGITAYPPAPPLYASECGVWSVSTVTVTPYWWEHREESQILRAVARFVCHELAHIWNVFWSYQKDGVRRLDNRYTYVQRDGSTSIWYLPHHSYRLNIHGRDLMAHGNSNWREKGDGYCESYTDISPEKFNIDLYMMGLIRPDEVRPIEILRPTDPAYLEDLNLATTREVGGYIDTITVDQIIAVCGPWYELEPITRPEEGEKVLEECSDGTYVVSREYLNGAWRDTGQTCER